MVIKKTRRKSLSQVSLQIIQIRGELNKENQRDRLQKVPSTTIWVLAAILSPRRMREFPTIRKTKEVSTKEEAPKTKLKESTEPPNEINFKMITFRPK
jgi:hypothetical protein